MNDLDELTARLQTLADLLAGRFPAVINETIQEFIDAGEYALALETLVGLLDEQGRAVDQMASGLIMELAKAMDMEEDIPSILRQSEDD